MCTVFAYEGDELCLEEVKGILRKTRRRGPDDERIEALPDGGFIAFQRLSIMGPDSRGMQPFHLGHLVSVTNGEFYGFRKEKKNLEKKGYVFSSDSDCEILNPMYMEYGTDTFGKLDAEYASVLYSSEEGLIAARDPIGIRPLFYGYDKKGKIAFASEACLLFPFINDVRPFPPGCYYKQGSFYRYRDIGEVKEVVKGSEEEITEGIRTRLIAGVEKRLDSDVPLGFLLSELLEFLFHRLSFICFLCFIGLWRILAITVPAAFSPTEIQQMIDMGADIVKVFPAGQLGPDYIKAVQAPLGKLPLMVVGGVNVDNVQSYFDKGATYAGIGSGIFDPADIEACDAANLAASVRRLEESVVW